MSHLSRGTRVLPRSLRQSALRQPRRNASDHGANHGSSESAYHVDGSASQGESFGKGFYIALTSVPLAYIAYSVSFSEDNFIKRAYKSYWADVERVGRQDILHATALEQAISDRSMLNSEPRAATRDIRYTEFFNQGSPWNVAAGEGSADLSKLEEYYLQQRKQIDEERAARTATKKV